MNFIKGLYGIGLYLREVNLSRLPIDWKVKNTSTEVIVDFLRHTQHCQFSIFNSSPEGLLAILDALRTNQTITHLSISINSSTLEIMEALVQLIRENKSLKSISFIESELEPSTAASFFSALADNSSLKSLDLGMTDIAIETFNALAKALQKNITLINLKTYRQARKPFDLSMHYSNGTWQLGKREIGNELEATLSLSITRNNQIKKINSDIACMEQKVSQYLFDSNNLPPPDLEKFYLEISQKFEEFGNLDPTVRQALHENLLQFMQ